MLAPMARQVATPDVPDASWQTATQASPVVPNQGPVAKHLLFLPPDWLPRVLLVGDAIIAGLSVLIAYWYHHNLDFINRVDREGLPFRPYVAAVPVVVTIYAFSLL